MEVHGDLIKTLLNQIKCKTELTNCMKDLNPSIERTYRECCDLFFKLDYDPFFELKIESVSDFLQDELNTGHWSKIPISLRQAFSGVSFVKVYIVLTRCIKDTVNTLQDALKCIDTGLLLGAPFNKNYDLLTQTAALLTCELNKIKEMESLGDQQLIKKRKSCNEHKEAYETLKGSEIVTMQCPSIEFFNKTYFVPQIPVKLQDCMLHWPASKKWLDVNYLLKVAGNRTVPIEIGSHYADENWTQKLMTLKEFIRIHYIGDSESVGYLAQHNLFDQISELKEDICTPEYCALSRDYEKDSPPNINAWFGPEGTVSPLHFDPKDNLLAQVFGTKQILLYAPSDSEFLYPHDDTLLFNTAQIDPVKPDSQKYPKYAQAKMYKCLLEAGEMLYIPPKWWHHVTSLDKSFSVSFWWQ